MRYVIYNQFPNLPQDIEFESNSLAEVISHAEGLGGYFAINERLKNGEEVFWNLSELKLIVECSLFAQR